LDLHFLSGYLPQDLANFAQENSYQYFIVSYWQNSDLTLQDQSLIKEAKLIKSFNGAACSRAYDINGNYQGSALILFEMKNLGPIVEIYKL
jgi:hypothetical protein